MLETGKTIEGLRIPLQSEMNVTQSRSRVIGASGSFHSLQRQATTDSVRSSSLISPSPLGGSSTGFAGGGGGGGGIPPVAMSSSARRRNWRRCKTLQPDISESRESRQREAGILSTLAAHES